MIRMVMSVLVCLLVCLLLGVSAASSACRVDNGVASCSDLCDVPAGTKVVLFSGDVLALRCLPPSVVVRSQKIEMKVLRFNSV